MNYEGLYRTTKDYLQPILQTMALSMALFSTLSEDKRTALIIGAVYMILYLLSSFASRHTGKFAESAGGEQKASKLLWLMNMLAFTVLGIAFYWHLKPVVIVTFIIIAVLQNFWRPILVSRCATLSNPDETATMLSIESQAKTIFTALTAPLIGLSIDYLSAINPEIKFLPVAVLGIIITFWMLITGNRNS